MRKGHRWGALLVALPFLLVIVTGLLLQIKKQWSWVQPPTKRGAGKVPEVSFAVILDAARRAPEAGIASWDDIERLDVRPERGIVKVRSMSDWEVQIDFQTGEVLHVAYRRSDLIEALHDGSWFSEGAKLWVFLPSGIIVLGLWFTGLYLFFLPWWVKLRRKRVEPAATVRV
jgi:uncharacterized iron-regulated membrane protein